MRIPGDGAIEKVRLLAFDSEQLALSGRGWPREQAVRLAGRAAQIAAEGVLTSSEEMLEHAYGCAAVAMSLADYASCAPGDRQRRTTGVWLHELGLGEAAEVLQAERGVAVLERLIEATERPELWVDGRALCRFVGVGLADPEATRAATEERLEREHRALQRRHPDRFPRARPIPPDAELFEREVLAALGPDAAAVLELRMEGRSERDIAQALGVSRRRIRDALEEIRTKAGLPAPER